MQCDNDDDGGGGGGASESGFLANQYGSGLSGMPRPAIGVIC